MNVTEKSDTATQWILKSQCGYCLIRVQWTEQRIVRASCEHIVLLDMKGCICHFTKWQIQPFLSKRRHILRPSRPFSQFYHLHILILREVKYNTALFQRPVYVHFCGIHWPSYSRAYTGFLLTNPAVRKRWIGVGLLLGQRHWQSNNIGSAVEWRVLYVYVIVSLRVF